MEKPLLITGLNDYQTIGENIRKSLPHAEKLDLKTGIFPDRERSHCIKSDPKHAHIVLVCGTHNDENFLDLVDVASASAKYGARSLTLIIPYFGYSTMERAVQSGDVIKAKVRARILSTIPQAKEGNQILFMDLHADGIPCYLEGNTAGHHIYAEKTVIDAITDLVKLKDPARILRTETFCIGSADDNRSKWVKTLARNLGVPAVTASKTRKSGEEVQLDSIQGDCQGKDVIIYDDMWRTGGTLLQAAKGYLLAGAKSVSAVATHGVLPNDALKRILDATHENKPLLDKLVCLDTLPHVHTLREGLNKKQQSRFFVHETTHIWTQAIKDYVL